MQSASVFPHRFSERQGEAAGSSRAEAHGPGPRDQAGRADRLHHLHPPPHVRGLGKGDCKVDMVREQNKIENLRNLLLHSIHVITWRFLNLIVEAFRQIEDKLPFAVVR